MRRIIVGLFFAVFCFTALGCQDKPDGDVFAPLPPQGSKPAGPALPK
jgi:hypothetical protein